MAPLLFLLGAKLSISSLLVVAVVVDPVPLLVGVVRVV
jgi:hypothetical protein